MARILITLLISCTSGLSFSAPRDTQYQGTVTFVKDIAVDQQDAYNAFAFIHLPHKKKCGIQVTSQKKMQISKGTVFSVKISMQEKEIWKDADEIGSRATTQFAIQVDPGNDLQWVSVACFSSGLMFPAAGLPTLKELEKMASPFLTITFQ